MVAGLQALLADAHAAGLAVPLVAGWAGRDRQFAATVRAGADLVPADDRGGHVIRRDDERLDEIRLHHEEGERDRDRPRDQPAEPDEDCLPERDLHDPTDHHTVNDDLGEEQPQRQPQERGVGGEDIRQPEREAHEQQADEPQHHGEAEGAEVGRLLDLHPAHRLAEAQCREQEGKQGESDPERERKHEECLQRGYAQPARTGFRKTPSLSISTSTTSPSAR